MNEFHALMKAYNMLTQLQDAIDKLDEFDPQLELSIAVARILSQDIYDCLESYRIENNY